MNNLFVINPEISKHQKIILWHKSEKAQDLFMLLTSMNIRIDGFCIEEFRYETFMGKKVYSILTMIEENDYALIIDAGEYEYLEKKYSPLGLDMNKVFVWIDERKEIMYLV